MTTDPNSPFKALADLLPGARNAEPLPTWTNGSDTPPATKIRGIPIGRISDSFENFDLKLNPEMKPALEQCQAVAQDKEWCALLVGPYGNGKTHLAVAALNQWRADHFDAGYFWKVPDFLSWIREHAFGDDGIPIDRLLRGYMLGWALLVLDDFGAENATDWAGEQLYRVLDARYDLKLPTIITTNQPLNRIDGRIASRFREGLVVCKGVDVRAKRRIQGSSPA